MVKEYHHRKKKTKDETLTDNADDEEDVEDVESKKSLRNALRANIIQSPPGLERDNDSLDLRRLS